MAQDRPVCYVDHFSALFLINQQVQYVARLEDRQGTHLNNSTSSHFIYEPASDNEGAEREIVPREASCINMCCL